jgi:regulator of RNase E activity RraA
MSLTPEAIKTLSHVSTATITTVLLKKGLRNVWIRGSRPLRPGLPRLVGSAFTLRFVPAREDLATPESWSSPISTRTAIEAMPEGCIAVVDAMGITDAGIFGDILCARMAKRGVAALVTDGVVRDVVIPKAFLDLILAEGAEQERMEAWIVEQVNSGAVLPGLYPMNAETKARYAASKK